MPGFINRSILNNEIRLAKGLNTGATVNLKAQPDRVQRYVASYPEVETRWGTLLGKPGPYTVPDLINPTQTQSQLLLQKHLIGLEDSLADFEDLQQLGMAVGKKSTKTSDKVLFDVMNRSGYGTSTDRTMALGERSSLTSDTGYIDNFYRQELGETAPFIQPARTTFVSSKDPNYSEVYRQHIDNGNEYLAKNINKFFVGGNPLPDAPTLQHTVEAVQPMGMRSDMPESDAYPMAPQSTINAVFKDSSPRQFVRFPTYEQTGPSVLLNQLGQHRDALKKKLSADLYRTGSPSTNTELRLASPDDPRVKEAIVNDNAAYLDYQSALADRTPTQSGSYNIVTSPKSYAQIQAEGLLPTDPGKPITGLYLDGQAWQPSSIDLKEQTLPSGLHLEVEGMGTFPFTGGALNDKIVLSEVEPSWIKDDTGKYSTAFRKGKNVDTYSLARDTVVRNPSEPIMMDAYEALAQKRKVTEVAGQRFSNALNDPNVDDATTLAHQQVYETHRQQLNKADRAYAAASRVEPVPEHQQVSVTVNPLTADDAIAISDLFNQHGLTIGSNSTEGVVSASGTLPIGKQLELQNAIASKYNREQVVLPPDVSIANQAKAFSNAGIAPNSFVTGVQWGKDAKGRDVITNPGTAVGTWSGSPIVVDERAMVPEVTTVNPTYAPVYESDPEMKEFLAQRDRAIAARSQSQPSSTQQTAIERAIAKVRAENGLGPMVAKVEPPTTTVSTWTNSDYPNPQASNLPLKEVAVVQPPFEETYSRAVDSFGPLIPYSDSAPNNRNPMQQRQPQPRARINRPDPTEARLRLEMEQEAASMGLSVEELMAQPIQRYASMDWVQPVVETAPVAEDVIAMAKARLLNSAPTQEAIQQVQMLDNASMRRARSTPVVRQATVNLNEVSDVPFQVMPASVAQAAPPSVTTAVATPQSFNIDWQDPASVPYQPDTAAPDQIVQDPIKTWNHYMTATAALGALGVGTGVGYALAPKRDEREEERLKQQYQQQMMQRR